jgi:hypothetical protein
LLIIPQAALASAPAKAKQLQTAKIIFEKLRNCRKNIIASSQNARMRHVR